MKKTIAGRIVFWYLQGQTWPDDEPFPKEVKKVMRKTQPSEVHLYEDDSILVIYRNWSGEVVWEEPVTDHQKRVANLILDR